MGVRRRSDVASASGGRCSERKEAPRSKVVGAPSRKQLLDTARVSPRQAILSAKVSSTVIFSVTPAGVRKNAERRVPSSAKTNPLGQLT